MQFFEIVLIIISTAYVGFSRLINKKIGKKYILGLLVFIIALQLILNGFRLQMIPAYVDEIVPYIDAIDNELTIDTDLSSEQESLIKVIGTEVDHYYLEEVKKIQLNPQVDKRHLKIIFTPQHGTALKLVEAVYDATGYDYITVKEQALADPAFSNTKTPNPEQAQAYDLALEYARQYDADIVLSTDPDADRLGVAVKVDNDYILMTGNQTGAVLLEYVFSQNIKNKTMPENPIMFNTIVTSDLGEKIADNYHVTTEKTLTGFKYIGDRIAYYEKSKTKHFMFGYEESYGYLIKPFVRDKDAVQACLIIAEAAAYYQQFNKTLWDVLIDQYKKYGWYQESQLSISGSGYDGAQMIKKLMHDLRSNNLRSIGDTKVVRYEDYLISKAYFDDQETDLTLPKADVLKYFLADGCWIAIRPSGTEPKCKIYFCITGKDQQETLSRDAYYKKMINKIIGN